MTNKELISNMKQTFQECEDIATKKNADYAEATDAFKNFRYAEMFGIPAEKGVLIRITDKLARVNNLLTRDAQVLDEKVTDTLNDAINYLAILKALIHDKRNNSNQ